MAVNEAVSYVDQFGTETLAGIVLVDGGAGQDFDLTIMPRTLRTFVEWLGRDRRQAADEFVRGLFLRSQSESFVQQMVEAALRTPANSAFTLATASVLTDDRAALAKIDRPTLTSPRLVHSSTPSVTCSAGFAAPVSSSCPTSATRCSSMPPTSSTPCSKIF